MTSVPQYLADYLKALWGLIREEKKNAYKCFPPHPLPFQRRNKSLLVSRTLSQMEAFPIDTSFSYDLRKHLFAPMQGQGQQTEYFLVGCILKYEIAGPRLPLPGPDHTANTQPLSQVWLDGGDGKKAGNW